jgi:CRP-like cAMP-binding protein
MLAPMSTFGPEVFPQPRPPDRLGKNWVPILRQLPLFEGVSARHLRRIRARAKHYAAGDSIVRLGDPGNAFYVILEGEVRVQPPRRRPVTLKAGDYFGEMALLDGAPRSADINAVGDVTTMVIGRAAFVKLLRVEPQIGAALLRTLATRLRDAQRQPQY